MTEKTLSPDTWRAKLKKPKVVSLASLGGAKVILRPLSALRKLELEKLSDNDSVLSRVIADTVVSGEIEGDDVLSQNGPIWKPEEIVSEEFPADALNELAGHVIDYLGLRSDQSKNSTPASDSPSVSP